MLQLENLTSFQKDQLLQFFFYYMPMEQRETLMATLPRAYNAAYGSKVVQVVSVTNGPVHVPLDKCEAQNKQTYNTL